MTTAIVSRRRFWKPFPLLATSAPLAISWSLGHLSLRSGGRSLIDTMLISLLFSLSQLSLHLTPESERDGNEQHSAVGALGLANLPGGLLPPHLAQCVQRARDRSEEETGFSGFHQFARSSIF